MDLLIFDLPKRGAVEMKTKIVKNHNYRRKGPRLVVDKIPTNPLESYKILFKDAAEDPWIIFIDLFLYRNYSERNENHFIYFVEAIENNELLSTVVCYLKKNRKEFNPIKDDFSPDLLSNNLKKRTKNIFLVIQNTFNEIKNITKKIVNKNGSFEILLKKEPSELALNFIKRKGYNFVIFEKDGNEEKIDSRKNEITG